MSSNALGFTFNRQENPALDRNKMYVKRKPVYDKTGSKVPFKRTTVNYNRKVSTASESDPFDVLGARRYYDKTVGLSVSDISSDEEGIAICLNDIPYIRDIDQSNELLVLNSRNSKKVDFKSLKLNALVESTSPFTVTVHARFVYTPNSCDAPTLSELMCKSGQYFGSAIRTKGKESMLSDGTKCAKLIQGFKPYFANQRLGNADTWTIQLIPNSITASSNGSIGNTERGAILTRGWKRINYDTFYTQKSEGKWGSDFQFASGGKWMRPIVLQFDGREVGTVNPRFNNAKCIPVNGAVWLLLSAHHAFLETGVQADATITIQSRVGYFDVKNVQSEKEVPKKSFNSAFSKPFTGVKREKIEEDEDDDDEVDMD